MRTKSHFTMIELMLALGVCVIGICGVMVLFPIGANASRDAAMETYAANAADQMLNLLKYRVLDGEWEKYIDEFPDENPKTAIDPGDNILQDKNNWEDLGNLAENVFRHKTNKSVFQVISSRDPTPEVDSPNVDFRAIMNVWRSDVVVGTTHLPHDMATQLNVEVSWPAALPYAARQKNTFILEVFNQPKP